MINTTIAHYRITSKLGQGGMGEVYRATDTKLNHQVASRSLPPDLIENEKTHSRFAREARALASVTCPNRATNHDVHEEGDQRQYDMFEYIPGKIL